MIRKIFLPRTIPNIRYLSQIGLNKATYHLSQIGLNKSENTLDILPSPVSYGNMFNQYFTVISSRLQWEERFGFSSRLHWPEKARFGISSRFVPGRPDSVLPVGCIGKGALAVGCTGKARFGVNSRLIALGRLDSALVVGCTGS